MKVKFYIDLAENNYDFNIKCLKGQEGLNLHASSYMSKIYGDNERIEFVVDLPDRFFLGDSATMTANVSDIMVWDKQ